MPTVRLKEDVYVRLKELRDRLGHQSMNDTVDYLLRMATNPKTFLESLAYFMEDVRKDVKQLKELLEELVKAIKNLQVAMKDFG